MSMKQLSTLDQVTQKLATLGHHMAFNNEQCLYDIVAYIRPRNNKR